VRSRRGQPVIQMRRALTAPIAVGCLLLRRVGGTSLDPAPYLDHLRACYAI